MRKWSQRTPLKVMMDTAQYYDTHDIFMDKDMRGEVVMMVPSIALDRTASMLYYVRLDSRAVSKVKGIEMLTVYNLVREIKVGYYRRDTWVECKFEDPNHRMVTTMTLIVRFDYIFVDHNGKKVFYKFKDKIVENYKLRHCKLNYIATDHRGKDMFSQVDQ